MRKGFWYVLSTVTVAALLLTACGGGGASTSPTTSAPAVSSPESGGAPGAATAPAAGATSPSTGGTGAGTTEAPTAAATSAASATEVAPSGTVTSTTGGTGGAALRSPQDAAMAAAGGKKLGGTVTVMGTWGGSEQDSFLAMVKPFEDATGVKVQYEGTRDLNAVLSTRVQGGNPPDLAGLPGPGQMAQFASQGKLIDLGTFMDKNTFAQQYSQSWTDLGTVNGKMVGIFIKASAKGLIWYDPKVWQAKGFQPPKTWNDLMTLSKQMADGGVAPWCVGLESGAASGWPGTDWLESIVLHQFGPDVYNQWWSGKLAWNSPQMKQAWQSWGQIVATPKMVYGGSNTMLTSNFGTAGDGLFSNPPKCYMYHQLSAITDFFTKDNPNIKPVDDFNFFPFPAFDSSNANSLEVAGDLFGMFKDTPQARALITYLTMPEAQAIWVQRGGAISPNKAVPLSMYPDPISKEVAQLMTSAQTTVFDASDLMPDAMNTAFFRATLDYVQSPNNLDSILNNLDSTRKSAYP